MNPNDPKNPLYSKGIWGGVVALLAGIGALTGWYQLSAEDIETLPVLFSGIAASVGGVVAIYGRATASQKIG